MKKYLALLLSLAFAVCLSACDRLPGSVGDLLDSTGDPAGSANTDSGCRLSGGRLCQWVYGGYHAYGVF